MAHVEALANPKLLVWARESAGLTEEAVAKKIGVKAERVRAWESGHERPSVAQLRNFAAATKRPLAVFYLAEPPHTFDALHDFRAGTGAEVPAATSPDLAFEIRKAYDRREWALELMSDLQLTPPTFNVRFRLDEDTEVAAGRIRSALGVRTEIQSQWRVDNEAFREWRGLLEQAGILTFQATDLELDEARGFSISLKPLPVVVVNIKDAYRGRIFTMLHEVTHLALNEGGICDLDDNQRRNASAQIEAYCNRVAGAVLFPMSDLLATSQVRNHRPSDMTWSSSEIQSLARKFGGSREALLVQLFRLGRTSEGFYYKKRDEYRAEYARRRERRKEGFAPPHVVSLSSAGPFFTNLVIENFNRDHITASDVSDYLQVRVKHIQEIQRDHSGPAPVVMAPRTSIMPPAARTSTRSLTTPTPPRSKRPPQTSPQRIPRSRSGSRRATR
jgi:Zn-dependent peptidase ImmA (M78 family)/transcriptional regulator with XRE-family HTH domain